MTEQHKTILAAIETATAHRDALKKAAAEFVRDWATRKVIDGMRRKAQQDIDDLMQILGDTRAPEAV